MPVFSRTLAVMNTRFSLVLPDVEVAHGENVVGRIGAGLVRDERIMSRFDPAAEVAVLNRLQPRRPVKISERLCEILALCRLHWKRTGGAFDVTLGAVNDNWRQGSVAPAPGGWAQVALDEDARTIAFAVPGIRIDLGAIGKGIALTTVARQLKQSGVACAFVSFGDSSIMVSGLQPGGSEWQVSVTDPFSHAAAALHNFALSDGSVSTSGANSARPHLVDPRSGEAVTETQLVAVACACPVEAEVLSTALIVRPPAKRAEIMANYPAVRAVAFRWLPVAGRIIAEKEWSHAA